MGEKDRRKRGEVKRWERGMEGEGEEEVRRGWEREREMKR
jgi:hypothetical protein